MKSYTQYQYTLNKRQTESIQFNPPLKIEPSLCLKNIGAMPVVLDGIIYISDMGGKVIVLDETDHSVLWEFPLPQAFNKTKDVAGDLVVNSNYLVVNCNYNLYILNSKTGELAHHTQGFLTNLVKAAISNDRLFTIINFEDDDENYLCCFDLRKKREVWKVRIKTGLGVITVDESLVFTNEQDTCCCLSAATGEDIWRFSVNDLGKYTDEYGTTHIGEVGGFIAAYKDLVVFPVNGNHIAALNSSTGELIYATKIKVEEPSNKFSLYADGNVCILDYNYYYSINALNGKIVASVRIVEEMDNYGIYSPTNHSVTENYVYFSDVFNGVIAALNKETGKIDWKLDLNTQIPDSHLPAIVNKRMYVLDVQGNLNVFVEND
jgi:outer membrane protein assembly factor BamB